MRVCEKESENMERELECDDNMGSVWESKCVQYNVFGKRKTACKKETNLESRSKQSISVMTRRPVITV